MKEEDPLKSKVSNEININLSQKSSSQNINYEEIKPLPLPPMKNILYMIHKNNKVIHKKIKHYL